MALSVSSVRGCQFGLNTAGDLVSFFHSVSSKESLFDVMLLSRDRSSVLFGPFKY